MAAFDGRIQLDGDGAPELEVIVELTDDYVILDHLSGELGRWERPSVAVQPAGGGWFTIVVEDEEVVFSPRRPGAFAGASAGLVPPVLDKRGQRRARKEQRSKEKAAKAETLGPPVKEKRRKQKVEEGDLSPEAVIPEPDAAAQVVEELGPTPALEVEALPTQVDVGSATEVPELIEGDPFGLPLDVPEDVPRKRAKKDKRHPAGKPATRRHIGEVGATAAGDQAVRQPEAVSPTREHLVVPSKREQRARARAESERAKLEQKAEKRRAEEIAAPKESWLRRATVATGRRIRHLALLISDELRQTGIVPFDRLPAADGSRRRAADHDHAFYEHRLPGGLIRNVCHDCGHVSIGDTDER